MKNLHRTLLKVVTAVSPFVIAACYGMYMEFSRTGRAVDAGTGNPIRGIRVTCRTRTGVDAATQTQTDGTFQLYSDEECTALQFDDVDGAENGRYLSRTVALDPAGEHVTVELTPEP